MANPALVSPPTLFTNREGRMMLTESDLITLDRRRFQREVAREFERIQSQPVPFSMVSCAKDFAEAKLLCLRRMWEDATPEERPRVEEEIAHCKALQTRCDTELAAQGETPLDRQDSPTTTESPGPRAADQAAFEDCVIRKPEAAVSQVRLAFGGGARSTVRGESTLHRASKELRHHRRRILETFGRKQEVSGMAAIAWKLGASVTALYGMVREDTLRYGNDKLDSVLGRIGCTRAEWDFLEKPSGPP
jgi:hypothetical protein